MEPQSLTFWWLIFAIVLGIWIAKAIPAVLCAMWRYLNKMIDAPLPHERKRHG